MSEKMQDKMFWQGEGFYKNTQRQNTNGEWRTEWEYTTYPVGTWFDEPDPECEIVWMNEGVEEPQPHDGENWVMFTNDEGFLDIAND